MLLSKQNLFPDLPYDINIRLCYHASQRCCDDFFSDSVCSATMNESDQHFWISNAIGYLFDHLLVTLAICRRHIVTDTDIATLKRCVKFSKLVDDVFIQVKDATVILAQLLDVVLIFILTSVKTKVFM
jgi:hypothetical protein